MAQSNLTWNQWLEQHGGGGLMQLSEALGKQPWDATEKDREAAWILYTEVRTRISTQSLHYRSGDEETALDSLYKLFEITRKTIEERGSDCRHVATLAIHVLNTHIRPLTAKWHKKKVEGRLLNDDERRDFRSELEVVRHRLTDFCRLLGNLAEREAYVEAGIVTPPTPAPDKTALESTIPFDRLLFARRPVVYDDLLASEQEAIRSRRGASKGEKIENLAGLACSGGGIRSATFCLGVVQSLASQGILPRIDYLSTVSGGGYFGSFLSSYLNDPDTGKVGLESEKLPFAEKGQPEPTPIRQLRNNSKYLLKGGLLGQSRMAGLLLFGILVNALTLLPLLFAALAATKILQWMGLGDEGFRSLIAVIPGGLGIVLIGMLAGLPIVYGKWAVDRQAIARYEKIAIVTALTLLGVWALGQLMPWMYSSLVEGLGSPISVFWLFALTPVGLAGAAFAVGQDHLAGRVLFALAAIGGPLLLLIGHFVLNERLGHGVWLVPLLLGVSAGLVWWLRHINVNQISPHRYYRNRLAETYLLCRDPADAADPQPLSQLRSKNPAAPYHPINAAVNLPASKEAELRGRSSDFFLFSQHYCGSPLVGYCATTELENKDAYLDLGTAMAISGAAASAHMGTGTLKGLEFMMALLNIRLGYWLPNPARLADVADDVGLRPFSLWRDLFGRMDEQGKYVNLSDGGHIENLGIYELLRRRCKFIIAIDAEADPEMRFSGLMTLLRYAQIDFGIRIHLDLGDLAKNRAGYSKAHFVPGIIEYDEQHRGYLLYIKSSLTGNERDYILDYHRRNPSFPHETTADQFFSEAQFEAYRALGNHIGEDLFREEFAPAGQVASLEGWFSAFADHLLQQPILAPGGATHG